jgi:hypothetical protein
MFFCAEHRICSGFQCFFAPNACVAYVNSSDDADDFLEAMLGSIRCDNMHQYAQIMIFANVQARLMPEFNRN